MKKVFTTGDIAKICNVAIRTATEWIDSGRLRGYRIPGKQRRRYVQRESLVRFMKANGIPMGGLEPEAWHRILVIGYQQDGCLSRLLELLSNDADFKIEMAKTTFDVGIQVQEFRPQTVIVDFAMGKPNGLSAIAWIHASPGFAGGRIAVLANEDEQLSVVEGVGRIFQKPFDVVSLVEWIKKVAV